MGLPGLPADYNHEAQTEEMESETLLDDFYGSDTARRKSPQQWAIEQIGKLNADQRMAFDKVKAAITGESQQKLFFIQGDGGTGYSVMLIVFKYIIGKTFVYNTLLRWCYAGKPNPDEPAHSNDVNKFYLN